MRDSITPKVAWPALWARSGLDVLVIGLISGTSMDGIDAALVRFDGGPSDLTWSLDAFRTTPLTGAQRDEIHHAILRGGAAAICLLNANLGEWFADAALDLCSSNGIAPRDIALIGSHGQTIWHVPPQTGRRGATLQLGCPATIAERTRIPVISDFRSRDVAAGGHGAPLVPWVDRLLFSVPDRARVLVNIGGMANLTRLGPRGSDQTVLAFDTGPGNALIDGLVEEATAGRATFDRDGERAARGRVNYTLLEAMLADPYFNQDPPKSTGRESFGRVRVQEMIEQAAPANDSDWDSLIATATALTAHSIANAIHRWVLPHGVDEVVVTGGGAANPVLLAWIRERLAPVSVRDATSVGIHADAKEAIAFAALAWAHSTRLPGNLPEVTGADGPRVLGSYTPA